MKLTSPHLYKYQLDKFIKTIKTGPDQGMYIAGKSISTTDESYRWESDKDQLEELALKPIIRHY